MDTTNFYSPVVTNAGEERKSTDLSTEPAVGTALIASLPIAVKVRDTASKDIPTLRPSSFGDSEFQVG